jgi:thiamine pyrophosphokinase
VPASETGLAIVLADGEAPSRAALDAAWPGWDAGLRSVVAADGGARHAAPLGLRVDRWVGDGDSVDAALLAALERGGTTIERVPAEKDASDSELALEAALAGATGSVAIVGGLGGLRIDHALTNLGLLDHPGLGGRPAFAYDEHAARLSMVIAPGPDGGPAHVERAGRIGDLVTLVPVGGDAGGVTTEGLRYRLANEPLVLGRTRGVSNVRTAPVARITLGSGRLLVIETPANLGA